MPVYRATVDGQNVAEWFEAPDRETALEYAYRIVLGAVGVVEAHAPKSKEIQNALV